MFEERATGADGRMTSKGELNIRCKNPDSVIGFDGVGRREEECGLGKVGPVGDLLHLFVVGDGQGRIECDDDGEGVAEVALVGEDIDLVEWVC